MAQIDVLLKAKTAQFQSGMERAGRALKGFERSANRTLASLGRVGKQLTVVGGLAAGGLAFGIRRAAKEIDILSKRSRQLGISTRDFTRLQAAAELSGTSIENVGKAVRNMQRRISESGQLETAARLFKALNIDVGTLRGQGSFDQLLTVATAFERITNQSDRMRIAMDLWGRAGQDMLTVIESGPAGLQAMKDAADAAGFSFNEFAGRSVEAANDAISRLGFILRGQLRQSAIVLAPIISNLADSMFNAATDGDTMRNTLNASMGAVAKIAFLTAEALDGLQLAMARFLRFTASGTLSLLQSFGGAASLANDPIALDVRLPMPGDDPAEVARENARNRAAFDAALARQEAENPRSTLEALVNTLDDAITKLESRQGGLMERLASFLQDITVGAPFRGARIKSTDQSAFNEEGQPHIRKFLSGNAAAPGGGSIGFRELSGVNASLSQTGAAFGTQRIDFERQQAKAMDDLLSLFKSGKARVQTVAIGGIGVPLIVTD